MKATGIIRKIDGLGRIVIPAEIRRTMRLNEGDQLEIFTDAGGEIIFKKYGMLNPLDDITSTYANTLHKVLHYPVIMVVRSVVMCVAGLSQKLTMDKPVSQELYDIMNKRNLHIAESAENMLCPIMDLEYRALAVAPLISNGDVCGAIVLLPKKSDMELPSLGEPELKALSTAAAFLSAVASN